MKIPLRIRILVVLLLVVTTVVGVITFVMAREFHEDKRTYLNDLTSVTALSTAAECRSLLTGYEERTRIYGRIVAGGEGLPREQRVRLLERLFSDYRELVGLTVYADGKKPVSVFDVNLLETAGLVAAEVVEQVGSSIPMDRVREGQPFVENSTLSPALPTFTMAIPVTPEGSTDVVVAVLRLDAFQRLSERSGVFDVVLVDAHGAPLAHPDVSWPAERKQFAIPEQATSLRGTNSAAVTVESVSDGTPMIGGWAGARYGGVVAGVLIPQAATYLASREILSRLFVVAGVLLALAAVVGLAGAHQITRRLEWLAGATREIAQGRFDIRVRVQSRDEIGTLAASFRRMGSELMKRENALEEAHSQLVQSEKMAAFGQLGAGIAHEVKNPLAGILGCAQLSLRKVEKESSVHRNLELIEKESRRCKTILENLLKFARQEKAAMGPVELAPMVKDACAIVNHQLELNKVKLDLIEETDVPVIRGNANQLQQVLLNLMMNAQQAMGGEAGHVWVRTVKSADGRAQVRVKDNGPGMPEWVREKVFEPFFTTKPTGQGTGLGLSVSYGILQEHDAEVVVNSIEGEGTEFVMTFPLASAGAREKSETGEPGKAGAAEKAGAPEKAGVPEKAGTAEKAESVRLPGSGPTGKVPRSKTDAAR